MAKVRKLSGKSSHAHRVAPYPSQSCNKKSAGDNHYSASERKDWKIATCPVCLEFPHNAVLLLCSSHDKGCRPYMCATNKRFSNCLAQYKKNYTKVTSAESSQEQEDPLNQSGLPELLCPLCRGQVKGWTVVKPARKYLNSKKRTCTQQNCSFVGSYKNLKRHTKTKHPMARPRAVDPVLEEKWKRFEGERERSDVISTIMSSTPGAVVLGDYVLEPGYHDDSFSSDDGYDSDASIDDLFFRPQSFNRAPSVNFVTSARGLNRIFGRARRQWRTRGNI
ncbi:hypothetical protein ACFE04_011611 [Oxalis oulophora]